YSSAGTPLWTNRYNGPENYDDRPTGLAVDGGGNVIVTGSTPSHYTTIKYSGAGVTLWTNTYAGPGNFDSATAMAVDSSGNVFVTGYSYNGNSYDYATIAYSGTGTALWTNIYDGPASSDDQSSAVTVDSSGNVFVTGSSYGISTGPDYATIKYSG